MWIPCKDCDKNLPELTVDTVKFIADTCEHCQIDRAKRLEDEIWETEDVDENDHDDKILPWWLI